MTKYRKGWMKYQTPVLKMEKKEKGYIPQKITLFSELKEGV